jgi:D-3-phosphoglycerate dehydrogenase
MKLLIVESLEFSSDALARLHRQFDVVTGDLDRPGVLRAVHDADVLWVRLRHAIDREVMDAAPRLAIVVTNTTGTNHIDLEEAARRGIRVLSLRGETDFLRNVRATAELAVGLLLALVRHIPAAAAHVRAGGWDRYPFKGHQIYGKTAGIIGYGRLGRLMAGYLAAFGLRVLATTKPGDEVTPDAGVTMTSLDTLLAESDIVSLHVDLRPETVRLIGRDAFRAMKPGAWFINTARGELVDESALVEALASGHLGGAAVDVIADPLHGAIAGRALHDYAAHHDNLIITPHIGGYTFESLAATEIFLADRLIHLVAPAPEH